MKILKNILLLLIGIIGTILLLIPWCIAWAVAMEESIEELNDKFWKFLFKHD